MCSESGETPKEKQVVKNGALGPNELPEDDRYRSLLPVRMDGSSGCR